MKKQNRYTTRKQITDALAAAYGQLAETVRLAYAEDDMAKSDAKAAAASKNAADRAHLEGQSRYHITERQRLFRAADRIEKIKIVKLGQALAAFDTQPMMAEGLDDEAVVLAK